MKKSTAISVIAILAVLAIALGICYLVNNKNNAETINVLTTEANDKNNQIDLLNETISAKDEQIKTLTYEIQEKANQIEALNTDVTNKDLEIAQLSRKAERVTELEKENKEQTKQIEDLKTALSEAATTAEEAQTKVSDLKTERKQLKDQIKSKDNQIEELTNKVNELQAQIDSTSTPAPTSESLQVGMTESEAVRAVQRRLKELGYFEGLIDGNFDDATLEAVIAFQKANDLPDDGLVGRDTLIKMNSKDAVTAEQATETVSPETVLYYNPEGGMYYHLDQNCKVIHEKYLPLSGQFTYAEINDEAYKQLQPCKICGAPLRK